MKRTRKASGAVVVEEQPAAEPKVPVWERNMNPEQLAVIRHTGGPICNYAVAGAGKTRALVHRIARMVADGVAPHLILAVTFSKKAADEMNHRLVELGVDGARVGTWHSLCLQILKEDKTEWAGWRIDEDDRAPLVMKEVAGYKHLNWRDADQTALKGFVTRCKANLAEPMSEAAQQLAREQFGYQAEQAMRAYDLYQRLVEERGMLTFDDFLLFVHRHFSRDEQARQKWAGRWSYVMVDECQDNNFAQKTLQEMLAREHRNLMVVGDVAQAIYGFRGSKPEYLATFATEWEATTVIMNRNYRSGSKIIDAANGIIRPAAMRLPVDMVAERGVEGKASAVCSPDLDAEGEAFAEWARAHVREGGSYADVTCLFRTNAQSRALEEALLGAKIPYVVVGGSSFYERKEVKDILGYLRVASGRDKDGDAVRRCSNAPFRFLGVAFVERVMAAAADRGEDSWSSVVRRVADQARVQFRQKQSAEEWASLVENVAEQVENGARPAAILNDVVHATRYLDYLRKEEGEESVENSRQSNVRELVRVAERFGKVTELLDYIDQNVAASRKQRKDAQAGGERVLLMSIHRSKGLEWPLVWVSGCNEKVLPHARGDVEEERRLAYVAATRARDELVMSFVSRFATAEGVKDAQPSRFLADAGLLGGSATRVASAVDPNAGAVYVGKEDSSLLVPEGEVLA